MIAETDMQVVEAVREARASRSPFEIVAGGTRRGYGRAVNAPALDVSRLSGIVNYEPEELILTVRPGTPLAEIEQAVAAKGQRLGFEPADWSALFGVTGTATIGGAVSCDANGPASLRYGRARDHLLGIGAVNGFGEAFKAGGRVVKNVTGFDIPKLVCGAFGTLCVLTELTFRVFPKPARSMTLALSGLDPREGFALLRKIWSSPLEATGLAYADGKALARLEGEKEPLGEKTAMLRAHGDFTEVEDGFRAFGNGLPFAGTRHDVWRMMLPPAEAASRAAAIDAPLWYGDLAGALLWFGVEPGTDMRSTGHATLMRGTTVAPFVPEIPARATLTRAVKAAFDPLGLFNPGRMYEDV